ncbi:hypothetical protein KIL84_009413 [Mauremys mutica]|uniref:CCAAT-binding factor domain-containing protein n=1 Tax=Mauremys mutica TaxID=74926 RepID=A0A9D3XII4_9SAUR|nr:hypothetical protein KIL84_009413 [Mauremys mutica]
MAQPGQSAAAALASSLESVLRSRGSANRVFEILELLQVDEEDVVLCAIRTCSRLFGALLERGELFVGQLPEEETPLADNYNAEDKYKIWMRHRYNSCVNCLVELMGHESFQVKELSLATLMKFVELEGKYPLVKAEWKGSFSFPRELLKLVVENLIPCEEDSSLLISRFQEYLEYDDIRYFVMKAVAENIGQVMQKTKEVPLPVYQQNVFSLISSISMPSQENEVVNFMVKQANQEEWKVSKLKEHKRAFERMWLGFLKHKLPTGLYKKVLVILHDSILPHLNEPTLMIDFLTVAYDIGGAISLLALNGLFVLIHQHNLEYPDFYKKLYSLLDPSIYHVKYRARFFHLADLFLSSSHLPAYLVAAFIKRLSRLALTAPPQALLMVIPFICNLFRRHPACKVLVHKPGGPEGNRGTERGLAALYQVFTKGPIHQLGKVKSHLRIPSWVLLTQIQSSLCVPCLSPGFHSPHGPSIKAPQSSPASCCSLPVSSSQAFPPSRGTEFLLGPSLMLGLPICSSALEAGSPV